MNRMQLNGIMSKATEVFAASGYECIETEWNQHDRILRLFVDHEDGIGLSDCLKANRVLDDDGQIEGEMPDGSTLEISSPGIERPLRRLQDFKKFVGSRIQVRLTDKVDGRRKDIGHLTAVSDKGEITLELDAGKWLFSVEQVLKANLIYEWQN